MAIAGPVREPCRGTWSRVQEAAIEESRAGVWRVCVGPNRHSNDYKTSEKLGWTVSWG